MKGMEAMIANMLGFTPQEMHETLQGFQSMIVDTKATLIRIEEKLDAVIASKTEGQNDDARDGDDASGGGANRSANGRGRRAGGDAPGPDAG